MPKFTEQQLQELETVFGLTRVPKAQLLPVRDGVVRKGQKVWWRSEQGPEQVVAKDEQGTWENIKEFPQLYSLAQPRTKPVEYLD